MKTVGVQEKRWRKWLLESSGELGICLDSEQVGLLALFVRELLDANQRLNLTRLTGDLEIAEHLILDSIFPGRFLGEGATVLDLGSGAGIPGVPLKIARRELSMTLIDARRKRVSFLQYVINHLGLAGISARHVRAEELARQGARFDAVICRAVSSLDQLISMAMPLVEKNGVFIAMKGEGWKREVSELKDSKEVRIGRDMVPVREFCISVETYHLPASGADRALIMVKHTE